MALMFVKAYSRYSQDGAQIKMITISVNGKQNQYTIAQENLPYLSKAGIQLLGKLGKKMICRFLRLHSENSV